jgi:hypothetical protein
MLKMKVFWKNEEKWMEKNGDNATDEDTGEIQF